MKVIKVSSCYDCPYANCDTFSDICGLLKSDRRIEVEHRKKVKDNCPLDDEVK